MKILYSIAGTYNSGGMERVLANKANWLVAHGHEVIIVTTDQRGSLLISHWMLESNAMTWLSIMRRITENRSSTN